MLPRVLLGLSYFECGSRVGASLGRMLLVTMMETPRLVPTKLWAKWIQRNITLERVVFDE